MDADRAIAVIESLLAPKVLNHVQGEIVRGTIAGCSYQQIVDNTKVELLSAKSEREAEPKSKLNSSFEQIDPAEPAKYKISYIKDTAAQLWQLLSLRLGKKVTKKSLAAVLLWSLKPSTSILMDDQNTISIVGHSGIALDGEGDFYGRTAELATLHDWCIAQHCRLVLLIGMGGMGKTRLAWETATRLNGQFDRIIWRSLINLPSVNQLCTDLIEFLQPQLVCDLPCSIEGQIESLIFCLQQDRCLLVLDNVESILAGQVQCGQYLPGYDGYDRLFRAIAELPHQSCTILTSREKPHTVARSEIVNPQLVRSLNIEGITPAAAHQLVQCYGCPPVPAPMWQEVHAHYDGNPLAMKIATITAVEMTGGGEKMLELYPLMKQGRLQFQTIDDILSRQFDRLSEIEQQLVYWLAISRIPITGSELRANLVLKSDVPGAIINAFQSLSRRCITSCVDRQWSIQPVMTAYATRRLIDRFVAELAPDLLTNIPITEILHRCPHLNTYAIIQPRATDLVLQAQSQSILQPTLDRLLTNWGNSARLGQYLHQLLTQWQTIHPSPSGYLGENLSSLIRANQGGGDKESRD